MQNPDNLHGFSYNTIDKNCYCLYEAGQLPDPLPAGTAQVVNSSGSGPIATTFDEVGLECYTYHTASVVTASPTTIPPTASPTTNPTFQFFGNGFCLDSQYSLYSWFTLPGLPGANACSDLCLQYPDYLHGFTYNNDGDGMCYCHYEVDQVPFPRPSESNVFFIGGRGPVASSSSVLGSGSGGQTLECYVYLDPAPTTSPTPSENEIQSTYPSQSPSDQPTSTLSAIPSTQPSSHPSLRPSLRSQAPTTAPNSRRCELPSANTGVDGPSLQYFPNWGGSNHVCIANDGTNVHPAGAPIYNDLESCCNFHYSWNMAQCNAVSGPSCKWLPNLEGGDLTCIQDATAQDLPFGARLYNDLESCCAHQYTWVKDECVNFHNS